MRHELRVWSLEIISLNFERGERKWDRTWRKAGNRYIHACCCGSQPGFDKAGELLRILYDNSPDREVLLRGMDSFPGKECGEWNPTRHLYESIIPQLLSMGELEQVCSLLELCLK